MNMMYLYTIEKHRKTVPLYQINLCLGKSLKWNLLIMLMQCKFHSEV